MDVGINESREDGAVWNPDDVSDCADALRRAHRLDPAGPDEYPPPGG